jgi:hemoglobin/transferrin/lactoferrin receptor protein
MNRLFLCILVCVWTQYAQAQFSITLFDKTSTQPLAFAQVNYEWTDEKTSTKNIRLALANNRGEFEIEEASIKNLAVFTITHPYIGTQSLTTLYLLQNNYKLYLSSNTKPLDEVVISGNRTPEKTANIPRQIEVVDKSAITFGNNQNTADLLFNQSNIYIQKSQQGGGSPILRGFEANRVVIMVDGVRLNNAIFRGGHLQNIIRIDQNILTSAEVLYGPGSVIYGSDAMGGVVSLNTRGPALNNTSKKLAIKNEFYIRSSSANNELTNHYNINIGSKKWAAFTAITHSTFGNIITGKNRNLSWGNLGLRPTFIKTINGVDQVVTNPNKYEQVESNYKQTDIIQKILFTPSTNSQHTLNLQYSTTSNVPRYDRLTDLTNAGILSSAAWYYGPEKRLLVAYTIASTLSQTWFDSYKITPAYQVIEESRHNRSYGSVWLSSRIEKVNVSSINVDLYKRIKKHNLHYGIDAQHNTVSSTAFRTNINTSEHQNISTRYPAGGSNYAFGALFLSHSIALSNRWLINEGIRFSKIYSEAKFGQSTLYYPFLPTSTIQNNYAVNGNIGLVYLLHKDTRFYTNIGNAFRAPNIDDLNKIFDSKTQFVILPNSNLKAEKSLTTDLGLNTIILKKLSINASVFYTQLYDAIVVQSTQINGSDSITYDGIKAKANTLLNAQKGFIYGWSINGKLVIKTNLHLYGASTYTYGRINNQQNLTPLDHIPPFYGKAGALLKLKGFVIDAYTQFNGAKPLQQYNINGEDNLQYATSNGLPAWYTVNFKTQYSVYKRGTLVTLQTGVENIFDTHYRLFASGISAMGRNFYATIRVGF